MTASKQGRVKHIVMWNLLADANGEKAKSIARKERSEALLHGKNGAIRARNTYGHDPSRSKG